MFIYSGTSTGSVPTAPLVADNSLSVAEPVEATKRLSILPFYYYLCTRKRVLPSDKGKVLCS